MTADGSHRPVDHEGFDFTVSVGVGNLVIDRTEKRNALARPMWRDIPEIIASVDADDSIGALVITGAGGHFSAGSDIGDLGVALPDFWQLNSTAEAAVANSSTPTIAAIEGNCVGGGTETAAACDIRIAAPGSIFGVAAAKLGLAYPPVSPRRRAHVGCDSRARSLPVTASIGKFAQMDERGFFHEVSGAPRAAAQELGERIVGRSRLSQIGAKEILDGRLTGQGTGPADAGADDGGPPEWLAAAYQEEIARGQEAFFAKRSPEFTFSKSDWNDGGRP